MFGKFDAISPSPQKKTGRGEESKSRDINYTIPPTVRSGLASCDVLDERAGAGSVRLCMTTIYQQCLNPVAASFYGMSKQQIFEKLLNTDLRELCEYVRRLFVVQSILIQLSTLQSEMSVGPFYVTRSNPTRQLTDPTQYN